MTFFTWPSKENREVFTSVTVVVSSSEMVGLAASA